MPWQFVDAPSQRPLPLGATAVSSVMQQQVGGLSECRAQCRARGISYGLSESWWVIHLRLAIAQKIEHALQATRQGHDRSQPILRRVMSSGNMEIIRATWLCQQHGLLMPKHHSADARAGVLSIQELSSHHATFGAHTFPVIEVEEIWSGDADGEAVGLLCSALDGVLPAYAGQGVHDLAVVVLWASLLQPRPRWLADAGRAELRDRCTRLSLNYSISDGVDVLRAKLTDVTAKRSQPGGGARAAPDSSCGSNGTPDDDAPVARCAAAAEEAAGDKAGRASEASQAVRAHAQRWGGDAATPRIQGGNAPPPTVRRMAEAERAAAEERQRAATCAYAQLAEARLSAAERRLAARRADARGSCDGGDGGRDEGTGYRVQDGESSRASHGVRGDAAPRLSRAEREFEQMQGAAILLQAAWARRRGGSLAEGDEIMDEAATGDDNGERGRLGRRSRRRHDAHAGDSGGQSEGGGEEGEGDDSDGTTDNGDGGGGGGGGGGDSDGGDSGGGDDGDDDGDAGGDGDGGGRARVSYGGAGGRGRGAVRLAVARSAGRLVEGTGYRVQGAGEEPSRLIDHAMGLHKLTLTRSPQGSFGLVVDFDEHGVAYVSAVEPGSAARLAMERGELRIGDGIVCLDGRPLRAGGTFLEYVPPSVLSLSVHLVPVVAVEKVGADLSTEQRALRSVDVLPAGWVQVRGDHTDHSPLATDYRSPPTTRHSSPTPPTQLSPTSTTSHWAQ